MFKQLTAYFESFHYFTDNQYGFRRAYNTQHAVLDLVEHIRMAIDRRLVTIVVFINFSVAFNSLHPSYIITTLFAGGLSNTSAHWIADSFTGRSFAVITADNTLTAWHRYDLGFGQGSRGGGLFFNSSSRCQLHVHDT